MPNIRNITIDCADPETLAPFWQAVTGFNPVISNEWIAELAPEDGGYPHLLLIKVPEVKSGKNRVHIDFQSDDREADIARLVALGATEGETHREYGIVWTVMHDPEGNELCIAEPHD